jgi:hypothetical protein
MLGRIMRLMVMMALGLIISAPAVPAQQEQSDYSGEQYQDYERTRIDRYLDVEIWTNHDDGEYYEGDNIVLNFRVNRDAFVAIYSIDSRDRVNLLFPSGPGEDNYVRGGVTYSLPNGLDDFDLVVTGPKGVENIQIIASRERFPIPDWYPTSGLICDAEDRYEYMDYLNEQYFVGYDGQRFAYDRASVFVEEWEPDYFRPVYYPYYYPWTICGNVYIDYPFGASIYIDGVYWGCAPLYIPRVYVGWHYFTVYDRYGYCWEAPVHVTRYHTIVLDHHVIGTSPNVMSKYKEVRFAGYRDPVKNGYPQYTEKSKAILKAAAIDPKTPIVKDDDAVTKKTETFFAGAKKYVRGSTELTKTDRGYETTGPVYGLEKGSQEIGYSRSKSVRLEKGQEANVKSGSDISIEKSSTGEYERKKTTSYRETGIVGGKSKSSDQSSNQKTKSTISLEKSSGYYQKKSGTAIESKSGSKQSTPKGGKSYNTGKTSGGSGSTAQPNRGSSGTSSSGKASPSTGGGKPSGGSGGGKDKK